MQKYLVILYLVLFPLSAASQFLLSRMVSSISNLHVNDLVQDDQGFMWIATAKGLCRYDGVGYNVFYHLQRQPRSIGSDNVNALYFDGRDLWCATGDGVSMFDMNTEH